MLPQGGIKATIATGADVRQQPTRTYAIVGNRIVGQVDGLEAMKQAVFKVLQTNRFEHTIYSGNYGHELNEALGADPGVARSIVGRRIKEALLVDDRIRAIEGMEITTNGDALTATFTVVTQFGNFKMTTEV
ncbi:DUF2634 domain-containing protein [Paenibacillus flagellatus]|uniref:DUF2634 domain-containing protein n=1 Tax=Paenibacillus flagellatus TaxID=2211139 RepID=A0A2V5KBT0_9BACL|nr:DUF2634 domain-containing protein [Paenibacillus flagellatus]PYI57015.1 DUF2634 domain-containing protein [Paenibacillus flagellatus]